MGCSDKREPVGTGKPEAVVNESASMAEEKEATAEEQAVAEIKKLGGQCRLDGQKRVVNVWFGPTTC
jgi:hypothetical protein